MLEIKPLTTADHFVHAIHPVAGARAVTPHVAAASVLVTISPQAVALSASRQRDAVKGENAKQKRAEFYSEAEAGAEAGDDVITEGYEDTKSSLLRMLAEE